MTVTEETIKTSGFRVNLAPRRGLKRKPGTMLKRNQNSLKAKNKPRRKKKTKADFNREWLVPVGKQRYVGLRGIYWYWLSRDIRKTEWEKYKVCITCLEPIDDWQKADCGHILPASNCGEYLRFNRKNLTIQHKKCNNPRFTPEAGALNAIHMDQRHGQGYMDELFSLRKKEAMEPKTDEYKKLIEALPSYQEAKNNRS